MDNTRYISSSTNSPEPFTTKWKAPSNIALVKYWGKINPQLPKNTSLSFTLSSSITTTEVVFMPNNKKTLEFKFYFEGVLKLDFYPKLKSFFNQINKYIPWIDSYSLKINSHNSFPHSSGIASSASSMAALSMCIMDMERKLFPQITIAEFNQKASFLARLGSGSAARSIEGPVTLWGENPFQPGSSDLYATPFGNNLHPIFVDYQDTIVLVDKGSKTISSTKGHQLMTNHPFADQRFVQAENNLVDLVQIMQTGNLDAFMKIVETEALSLHAMMMTSNPYFILMKPNTLEIIYLVWKFRKETQTPLCFTLDAGANLHLLYPKSNKQEVCAFISESIATYCQDGQYLFDEVGSGAKKV